MTTREEYAEAAAVFENLHTSARRVPTKEETRLAARVLRALADGAVLCWENYGMDKPQRFEPLDPQP